MPSVSMDSIANLSPELQRAFQSAVTAEKKPLDKISERKSHVEEKVGLLNDVLTKVDNVKRLLPDLNSPLAIRDLAVNSDDQRLATATADKNLAEPGKHSLEVLQLASKASALSNTFEDKDRTKIGTGYITFTTSQGDTREIYIDNENSTLEGLARVINSARIGIKANVINDQSNPDAPYRLLLNADGVGAGQDIEYPEFYFIDGQEDFYIDHQRAATNALVKYEGFEIESPSNEIKDLVRGVTINIKGTTDPGRPVSLSVEQDLPKTTVKVKDLVENLNQVFSFIQNQNKLDEKTQTVKTLGGDYGIRMAENRLREALQANRLFDENAGSVRTLNDLGIQFTKAGTLNFDQKRFENALNNDYEGVVSFLVGDGNNPGVIVKLGRALNSISGGQGALLSAQKNNYMSQINRFDKEIETREKNAEKRLDSLKEKLGKTQAALATLQSQTNNFAGGGGGGLAGALL